jgi:DNA repair protein RecO (recombination protein O)
VIALGGVVSDKVAPPGSPRIDAEVLDLLIALARGDWPVAEATSPKARKQASALITAYTQYHVERSVKALAAMDRERQSSAKKSAGAA